MRQLESAAQPSVAIRLEAGLPDIRVQLETAKSGVMQLRRALQAERKQANVAYAVATDALDELSELSPDEAVGVKRDELLRAHAERNTQQALGEDAVLEIEMLIGYVIRRL